ncbi:hypothetical protein [Prosthecomicrobium sp. N25]|uniref:hypothetical protein n=1 Tax=Prosthecomicrobium sp. N25 TaxID=3129254 RepID=UPI00307889F9
MIPTLLGRWQTRILLFAVIGLPVTFVVALAFAGWSWPPLWEPFLFLGTLLAVGLILDVVYFNMQRFRWDHDWPFAFFTFFSFVEFFIVFGLMRLNWLPYLPACQFEGRNPATRELVCQVYTISFADALTHFLLVFLPMLLAVLAAVQVFAIRWRFKGGELGRFPVTE